MTVELCGRYWPQAAARRVVQIINPLTLVLALALALSSPAVSTQLAPHETITEAELKLLREETREMFYHAWDGYLKYAFPADELRPLSCTGRNGKADKRGNMDDPLGEYSLTLIDAMPTLLVLGDVDRFEDAVRKTIKHVSFARDSVVSVFEATIRVLGGLLSSHVLIMERQLFRDWYNNELLALAEDLADRLLPAFATPTGLPYQRVNLRHGVPPSEVAHTCTACAGTLILEFGLLSRLTGKPKYEAVALRALEAIWKSRSALSLSGSQIDVLSGQWRETDSGVGAGVDSYLEYLLKSYLFLGHAEHYEWFNATYNSVQRYSRTDDWYLPVDMHSGAVRYTFVDSLSAFWPGVQVMIGDLEAAQRAHARYEALWAQYGGLPERFDVVAQRPIQGISYYALRPEFIESTYFLYRATRDPRYLISGRNVLIALRRYRTRCGYAASSAVDNFRLEDRMDSFFLAETCKYLYLLFDDNNWLHSGNYIFTTEAHPLPLSLAWHGHTRAIAGGECAAPPPRNVTADLADLPSSLGARLQPVAPLTCPATDVSPLAVRVHVQGIERAAVTQLRLGVLGPEDEALIADRFYALRGQFSPALPQKGLSAPVVIAQPRNACQILSNEHDQIEGSIVLVERGGCTFTEKATFVAAAGGVAAVIINKQGPDVFTMAPSVSSETDFLPSFMVGNDDGQELLRLARRHSRSVPKDPLKFNTTCHWSEKPFHLNLRPLRPSIAEDEVEAVLQIQLWLNSTATKVLPAARLRHVSIPTPIVTPLRDGHVFLSGRLATVSLPAPHAVRIRGATADLTFNPRGDQLWATLQVPTSSDSVAQQSGKSGTNQKTGSP